jgi:hypothetical protein
VRRVIEEGVNKRNLSVFDESISPSFVDHEAEGSAVRRTTRTGVRVRRRTEAERLTVVLGQKVARLGVPSVGV